MYKYVRNVDAKRGCREAASIMYVAEMKTIDPKIIPYFVFASSVEREIWESFLDIGFICCGKNNNAVASILLSSCGQTFV